jgi:hypothetical protein
MVLQGPLKGRTHRYRNAGTETMNSHEGFRKAEGGFPRAAARAVTLIVITIWAMLWAGMADQALAFGVVLTSLTAAALTFAYDRRRTVGRRGAERQGGMHARATRPRADGAVNSVADPSQPEGPAEAGGYWATGDPWIGRPDPPRPGAGLSVPEDDYPSWPGRPSPYALRPDHPSWPGRPDPRWAGTEAVLRANDYSSRPERQVAPCTSATTTARPTR